MPKASSSTTNRPALRRNQACRSCRKRKLKCDAARPHCGTCVKQWQALISVPAPVGYAHPSEPQCSYDPVEGLTLAPDTDPMVKIKSLEDEIALLKNRLFEQQTLSRASSSESPGQVHISSGHRHGYGESTHLDTSDMVGNSISLPQAAMDITSLLSSDSPEGRFRGQSNSPGILAMHGSGPSESFLDLFLSGWNPELPDPPVLSHYIDVFFRCDPCGSRILHRSSFLASMLLPPKHPNFPHPAILHAINVVISPDGTRRDHFAEFHVGKTRQYIDKTVATGADIFSVVQACILLAWYFYQEGRWVEVWIFAGFQTRVAIPLRLNYPGTFTTHGNNSPGAFLAPPKDFRDLEARRRTWWMTIIFDRICSFGGWIHAVDERDLGTELPLRADDFEAELAVPANPQDLSHLDFFLNHPPLYTDSFILFLKAVMLFGRVTDFNVRGNLRAPAAPTKSQNPFYIDGFEQLDKLTCTDFLEHLPQFYKHNFGLSELPGGSVDTDLYMVHLIPHAATITLHNPYIDFADLQCVSTARCLNSARCILSAYYMLSATSLDITRLHPTVTIVWYLAAVVQVHLCKYFIEIGDTEREANVWGEINVLRFAMLAYGERSPIGTRQERLLQGLMREIVRITAQKQPLEMGVPLFPFSHAGVFGDRKTGGEGEGEPAIGVPLPSSPPLEEAHLSPPSVSAGLSPGMSSTRSVSMTWSGSSPGVEEILVPPPRGSYL